MQIGLAYVSDLPEEPFEAFATAVRRPGLRLKVEASPPFGPMAGVEWLLPTAVVLFFAKSYFDSFLKEMGKDHYDSLKIGCHSLWQAFVGPEREITVHLVGTRGKINPNSTYSHLFSIYSETPDGRRIKFLFEDNSDRESFMEELGAVITALEEFHAGEPRSIIRCGIQNANIPRRMYLLHYNRTEGRLEFVDPYPKHRPGSEEST